MIAPRKDAPSTTALYDKSTSSTISTTASSDHAVAVRVIGRGRRNFRIAAFAFCVIAPPQVVLGLVTRTIRAPATQRRASTLAEEETLPPSTTRVERGQFWEWDPRVNECGCAVPVHYTRASQRSRRRWFSQPKPSPLVFLHGFGVGEFHFDGNLEAMASMTGRDCYAFDWVGQGKSWPRCGEGKGLRVSAETWVLQLDHFLRAVVKEPAVLVGNSLGGFLAALEASRQPQKVAGLALLNPTPFWGLWSSDTGSPIWDATLPAPRVPRAIGATWFNTLRDPATVCALLQQVYSSPERCDADLVDKICEAAEAEYGPNVFASILFSPRPKQTFDDALRATYQAGVPIGLVYGKNDPWVSPVWGQRAFRRCDRSVPYYELSPTGHCPHHESPAATNYVLCDWLRTLDKKGQPPLFDKDLVVTEDDGRKIDVQRVDGVPRDTVESAAEYIWG